LEPGYKYNLTDIAAVLGLGQLARVDEFNRRRSELAARYRERFTEIDEVLPLGDVAWPQKHAWHLFVIRLDTDKVGMDRDTFMAELKARNVGTGIHFRAVHTHRFYRERFGLVPGFLPNTEWSSNRMCSIPLFPAMTNDDVDSVVDTIKEVLSS
jgi:UDP-4-amino-4-deoxy-L-arabinose-oxoglutarate aminotransferase